MSVRFADLRVVSFPRNDGSVSWSCRGVESSPHVAFRRHRAPRVGIRDDDRRSLCEMVVPSEDLTLRLGRPLSLCSEVDRDI